MSLLETALVLFLIVLVVIMLLPNPKQEKRKRYRDTTIEVVNGKFMEIDKRRWDAEI